MNGADLLLRRHRDGDTISEAVYCGSGLYRYALTRCWDAGLPRLAFVMLNPSTASERHDDPTVGRCVRRARRGGWGAVRVVNVFAFRATDPALLKAAPEPVGPRNDEALAAACRWADAVVAAWGVHGAHLGRGAATASLLRRQARRLMHLGLTQAGHPRHPLYLSYAVEPELWVEA